jgi:ABC-type Co2+ transport system permease subunit
MQGWLLVNFSINVALLVGIPLLVIHIAILLDAISFWYVKGFVYLLFLLLILASTYISSFIRAFFAYYWYQAFMKTNSQSYTK